MYKNIEIKQKRVVYEDYLHRHGLAIAVFSSSLILDVRPHVTIY
jgi:hypothetical protein